MIKVKPLGGAHPGFAPLAPTAIAKVQTASKAVKVNNETVNTVGIKFLDATGRCFAEMNSARNDVAYIKLADEQMKPIGSFITGDEQTLSFPEKGTMSSTPSGPPQQSKTSGTWYTRHDVVLSGVKFADLIAG